MNELKRKKQSKKPKMNLGSLISFLVWGLGNMIIFGSVLYLKIKIASPNDISDQILVAFIMLGWLYFQLSIGLRLWDVKAR